MSDFDVFRAGRAVRFLPGSDPSVVPQDSPIGALGAIQPGAFVEHVLNEGSTVTVDDTGITVTDGSITVNNGQPGVGDVIIDGTSNMFKIAATGTLSMTINADANNSTSVALSALGSAFTEVPAFLAFINFGNETFRRGSWAQYSGSNGLWYVASSSGGAVTTEVTGLGLATAEVVVALTAGELVVWLAGVNSLPTSLGVTVRYYILQEAGI